MNMLRRNFIRSAALGVLGFLGFAKAKATDLGKYVAPLRTPGEFIIAPKTNEVVLKDWRNGRSTWYTFIKGPNFTTAEDAWGEMEKVLPLAQWDNSNIFHMNACKNIEGNQIDTSIVELKSIGFMEKIS